MERKKLTHLYFDLNIFKYIKDPRNTQDEHFAKFIYSIKDYINIAYSPFHIAGLTKNFDESKWDFITKDCDLISRITNNLCIYYDNNNQIHIEYRSPLEMFIDQLDTNSFIENIDSDKLYIMLSEEKKKEFENNFFSVKHNKDVEKATDPYSNILINSETPEEAFKQLIIFNKNFETDPDTYKNIRAHISGLNKLIENLSEEEKEKINQALIVQGINKKINELEVDDFLQISSKFIEQQFNTEISNSYTFKDLFGITKPEDITKKNTFKNIIDDSFHLEMAQYSLFYISEDKSNLEKAKLTSKEMDLNTEIFTIEEANKYIKISLFTLKAVNPEK